MNLLFNILFIFLFIYISLLIGIPGTSNDNLIKNKIYLFGGIFIFQLIINFIKKYKKKCKNNIKHIINDGILVATLSIIGYSLYIDLITMNLTREYFRKLSNNRQFTSFIISSVICIFIMSIKILQMVIKSEYTECNNLN